MKFLKTFILLMPIVIGTVFALEGFGMFSFRKFFNGFYQNIEFVEIKGNKIVQKEEIISLLYNTNKQDKLLFKTKKQIIQNIKGIPLIVGVEIKYFLPSKLVISVKERKPIMFYHTSNLEPQIVDSTFEEFFDSRVNLESLIYIRGSYNKEHIKKLLLLLVQFPNVYHNVTEIENFADYRFNIVLNNKMFVLLPESNIKAALLKLQEYITKYNLLRTGVYKIDMRANNKVILSSNKNITIYKPESSHYIIYRNRPSSNFYRQTINKALQNF